VGVAESVASAHQMLARQPVDIILLDLELPDVHGLDALPELIVKGQGARVLIVSSACADGATATLAALRAGAADTLLKPGAVHLNGRFAAELMDRIRRIARPSESGTKARSSRKRPALSLTGDRIECVAIGSSTGGVPALARFFEALPSSFASPILVTQHLPAPFMAYFAGQLTEMSGRIATLAKPGLQPRAGEILLAPGDAHLTLVRTGPVIHVRLERGRVASACMPSVDPMLASIGKVYGESGVGVILSGMGRDGVAGAAKLVEAGGTVVAQDEASSVVWGMPGAVANAQLAKLVLAPDALARAIAGTDEGYGAWN
jgi:two-component system, chemotaxis family, protein-glutamate methylesterase/glutaminase